MSDTTISGLTRQSSILTRGVIPVSIDGVTVGVPVSAIVTAIGDMGTGFITLPTGNSTQRTTPASSGALRYNNELNALEWYNGISWTASNSYTVDVLIVAGGGGGGSGSYGSGSQPNGGGGAGGGVQNFSTTATPGATFPIVVGGGGGPNSAGGDSAAFNMISYGGNPHSGMSGGTSGAPTVYSGGSSVQFAGGGGGGAGGAGTNAYSTYYGGTGGVGLYFGNFSTFGQNGYFGGGGGGGQAYGGGAGGQGGGGQGGSGPTSGTVNTGGGGGGGYGVNNSGSNGGSGIVIIKYAGAQRGSGGTITTTGGFTYHLFGSVGSTDFIP